MARLWNSRGTLWGVLLWIIQQNHPKFPWLHSMSYRGHARAIRETILLLSLLAVESLPFLLPDIYIAIFDSHLTHLHLSVANSLRVFIRTYFRDLLDMLSLGMCAHLMP